MKIIRCLNCNKVLGEVEGKAKIKCKMAGCHCMNVIDTDAGVQWREPNPIFGQGIVEKPIPLQMNGVLIPDNYAIQDDIIDKLTPRKKRIT